MRSAYLILVVSVAVSVSCAKSENAGSAADQSSATFQADPLTVARSVDECRIFSTPRKLKRIWSSAGTSATEFKRITEFNRTASAGELKAEYGVMVSFDLGYNFLMPLPAQQGMSVSQAADTLVSKLIQLSKSGAKVVLSCVGSTRYSSLNSQLNFISIGYGRPYEGQNSSVSGLVFIENIEMN